MNELEEAQSKGGWNFSLIFPEPEPLKTTFPLSNAVFHPGLFLVIPAFRDKSYAE